MYYCGYGSNSSFPKPLACWQPDSKDWWSLFYQWARSVHDMKWGQEQHVEGTRPSWQGATLRTMEARVGRVCNGWPWSLINSLFYKWFCLCKLLHSHSSPLIGSKLLLENGTLHWVSHPGYKTQWYLHMYVILPWMTHIGAKNTISHTGVETIIFGMALSYMHGDMPQASVVVVVKFFISPCHK